MKMNIHITGCWVMFMASQVLSQSTSDGETDMSSNDMGGHYVDILFYKASLDDWNNKEGDIKRIVAKKSTMYCRNRAEECGMKPDSEKNNETSTSHHFLPSGVKIGSAEQERIYVKVPLTVNLPANATEENGDPYLNENTLKQILKESAKDIKTETGLTLRKVGEDDIDYPPNDTLNAAIIPVAIIILLGFIVAAIIIRIRLTKKDHKKVADEVALEKKKPLKLVAMKKTELPATSSSTDGNQTVNKEGDDASGNVAESAALLEDKDGNAVKA